MTVAIGFSTPDFNLVFIILFELPESTLKDLLYRIGYKWGATKTGGLTTAERRQKALVRDREFLVPFSLAQALERTGQYVIVELVISCTPLPRTACCTTLFAIQTSLMSNSRPTITIGPENEVTQLKTTTSEEPVPAPSTEGKTKSEAK